MADDRGSAKLRQNLRDQLDRCLEQLSDLQKAKDEMETEDYEEQYKDTLEQLKELDDSLTKMKSGNLSLLDDISAMQLAISAAISKAFSTPEILSLFAARQPDQLRERLAMVERDRKINKMTEDKFTQAKTEILSALIKLRATLTPEEQHFLHQNASQNLAHFVGTDNTTSTNSKTVLDIASKASID
ncbi:putative Protein LZIC [Hypsibius exemplaris]|uniref:Beta-catenin-interacting ICAT domain-containing protein n=1 Tax=Hypsibius exemplaris TaxID=2072580 RepID=A0A1W0WFC0_HYPEX|nr:putative Protein LZIC [Hypsibius exemplaris]